MITEELIYDAKAGNILAIEKIFENFNKVLSYHGKKYFISGGSNEDIIQEASIGLLQAISDYDKNKGNSFENFAFLCIKRQLIGAIRNSNCGKNKFLNSAILQPETDSFSYEKKSIKFYTPEEILLSKEKIRALDLYLKENLSVIEKEVFEHMILDFKYSEIAKKLKKNLKSIDNTIQRIRNKIKIFELKYKNNTL